jgi:hypothetical protein
MCVCKCVYTYHNRRRLLQGRCHDFDGLFFMDMCVYECVCVCVRVCVCVCVCTGAITCDFFLIGFVMTLKAYVLCIYMLGYILCMFANA